MKFKTLKDCKNKEEARQEAIKEVRALERQYFLSSNLITKTEWEYQAQAREMTGINQRIVWIKHFFNLTEEELKEVFKMKQTKITFIFSDEKRINEVEQQLREFLIEGKDRKVYSGYIFEGTKLVE